MVAHLAIALSLLLLPGTWRRSAAAEPPRNEGVVVYSDPAWGRLYVHDGRAVAEVAADGLTQLPAAGHRVEIAADLVRDLGPAALPEAVPPARSPASGDGPRWVALEGTVRAARAGDGTRGLLRAATQVGLIDVHVPAPPPAAAPRAGARVRLVGVLEAAPDAWSRPRLWAADWRAVIVRAPSPPWEQVRRLTIAEARDLAGAGPADEVRVLGRVLARRSALSFRLGDGRETIPAELDRPDAVRNGSALEVRGFLDTRRGEPVIVHARWRSNGTPASELSRREAGLPTLTRVSQVRGLTRAEAERGYPVRLQAVATYVAPASGHLFVQDETGGLYVALGGRNPGLTPGERVRLEGFTTPGALAPMVTGTIRRLGPGRLPEATVVSTARLAAGYDDCRRVELAGVVRGVRGDDEGTLLLLGVEGQRVPVHLPLSRLDRELAPVDARVRVRGVCGTQFNQRGLFERAELFVADPGDLTVLERPGPPFALPLVPASDLLRSGADGRWERLVRTRAVLLHHREGQPLYLRGDAGTLVAESDSAQPLVPGDELEVVGFPAPTPATPRLQDAFFRRLAHGPPPAPVALAAVQVLGPDLDGELTRFQATLVEVVEHETGTSLILQGADQVIEALGDGDLLPRPPDGSRLEVTGVLLAGEAGAAAGSRPRVLLRGPGDVRLIAQPPLLTGRRAATIAGALAVTALLALAWVLTLRRQVRARTAEASAAEQRYRLLADNASDVILTTDQALRLTYVSPSVVRDLGYTTEEALALPLERALTPESWQALTTAVARDGELPGTEDLELEILRKDGSSRWMHVRTSVLRDAAGARTGFLAAARDVTVRRRAQQELDRLAAAIEQSVDTVVLTDPAGVILYVNPAFERSTGYAAAEVLGRKPAVWKSGAHDRAFYDALWDTLKAGRTWEGRFTNRRRDGQLFLEDASISPVVDRRQGRLIGYVAVKRDVTRQVALEGQVAQAQKMEALGRLAAGIAHDFNNVLAIVLSLADLALQRGRSPERVASYLNGIREAALRAGGLTRQILTFSRQSPGQMQAIDPREVVGEAVRMLRVLLPPGVEVRERLESRALVAADATQLQQVVVNLGSNAGQSMPERGGTIEIALEDASVDEAFAEGHRPLRAGACVRLVVSDRGCGMSPETIARIYEPFFTTRASRDGTGMGLAVVHGIVHGHGGTITVISEEGRGSTFCVYLPALPPRPAAPAPRLTP